MQTPPAAESGTRAAESRPHGIAVRLAGLSDYRASWALQRSLWEARRSLRVPDTLLLVEHTPVLTLGRHADERHILSPEGIDVVRIERGGDVTYHGPGQLTAYLIADLRTHDLGVRAYVGRLEAMVRRALACFGIAGEARPGLTGVWVRLAAGGWAKIAALGVRVSRGVTLHGVALNVRGPLEGFARIVPCGLTGEAVTSMEAIAGFDAATEGDAATAGDAAANRDGAAGGAAVDFEAVAAALREACGEVLGIEFRAVTAGPVDGAGAAAALRTRLEREAVRGARKPRWLRTRLPGGESYRRVRAVLREGHLHTVCESARCPNCHECWNAGTATFLILGDACTRACRFCAIGSARPAPPDPGEPQEVARAAHLLGLRHVVITSVTRDDLPDGGAAHFVATVRAVRAALPQATVELLIPDFGGDAPALDAVLAVRPEVLNHNVETVPRLYAPVRPGADYARSLAVLRRAAARGLVAKSGFMLGLGESAREVRELLRDLYAAGCRHVTIGQYLQPTRASLPVQRYYTEAEFAAWKARAGEMGFARVESGPLVRSSYHAGCGSDTLPERM